MSAEIEEDDYTLTPSGHLGGKTSVAKENRLLGEFNSTEEALAFIGENMEEEQFWPSIWWISDHGNFWAINLQGEEIPDDDE